MKLLITGANGFLGQHLTLHLHKKSYDVYPTSRGKSRIPNTNLPYLELDLTDKKAVIDQICQINPGTIIHTAAMSKPDECHLNREDCLLHNVQSTEFLLEAAKLVGARFIYVSTDFIFGENGPHAETAEPNPLNFYGETKLMAEELVNSSGLAHNIVRPVFIYGRHWEGMRPSFIQWVSASLSAGKAIKVVNDQFRTPTYVEDICRGLELLIQKNTNESFHFAGLDILSPYEMALIVAKTLGLNSKLIEPVTADSFPEIVQRAKHSGLLIDKAKLILGYAPISFEKAVKNSFSADEI